MKYYKYSQLVKEYNVSDRTVRNWVEASLKGKVDLKLHEAKGRYYVANSVSNNAILESLADHGKKYRNSRSSKSVEPNRSFYETYSPDQVVDIINSLEKNHELPWDYTYFGNSAEYWDEYLMELHAAKNGNNITNSIETLKLNYAYLDALIEKYDYVNVVNVCIGNNIAIHDLLSRIKASGKLNRFIAADISKDMLDIAGRNIDRWFSGSIKMERCLVDIKRQPLGLISMDSNVSTGENTVNVFIMAAGVIANFDNQQRVLENLNASMSKDDILITTDKRSTPQSRGFFDFNTSQDTSQLGFRRAKLLEMLGIEESFYDIVREYDSDTRKKLLRIVLKVDLTLDFTVLGKNKEIYFEKGTSIVMWFAHMQPDRDFLMTLDLAGFDPLLAAQSTDQQLRLTISKPRAAGASYRNPA